jgi:hypothetical protein
VRLPRTDNGYYFRRDRAAHLLGKVHSAYLNTTSTTHPHACLKSAEKGMKKEAKKRIKLELLYPFMHDEKFIYPVSISQELS